MPQLFTPLKIRELTLKNRVFVSPMCQYSADQGVPNDWHLVHLGSRAVGGAALVLSEATAVSPEGRISPGDTGLWNLEQEKAFAKTAAFVRNQGAVVGIQLAHAGRKASTAVPWLGKLADADKWEVLGPSAEAFSPSHAVPRELSLREIDGIVDQFAQATERSLRAGFQVIELHMAHGYLLHEFLSPHSNHRRDEYGGSLENRMRLPLRIVAEVRRRWPQELPLFVRISASDWTPDGGWTAEDSIVLARRFKDAGVDFIDCSSGGNVNEAKIPVAPGYQVRFAEAIRRQAGVLTGAVGLITEPQQAEEILANGQADAILLARQLLRDPYWPLHAARILGAEVVWPKQYERAKQASVPKQ